MPTRLAWSILSTVPACVIFLSNSLFSWLVRSLQTEHSPHLQVVFHSPSQQHGFNFPFQIGSFDSMSDSPSASQRFSVPVEVRGQIQESILPDYFPAQRLFDLPWWGNWDSSKAFCDSIWRLDNRGIMTWVLAQLNRGKCSNHVAPDIEPSSAVTDSSGEILIRSSRLYKYSLYDIMFSTLQGFALMCTWRC